VAQKLNASDAALVSLANINGLPFLGMLLSLGVLISFFACTLSCITTASRTMFMMGHHGLLHPSLSQAHTHNQTPHIAVLLTTILGAVPAIILSLCHCSLIDIITWTGTIAAYSYISSYALVSIAAPNYLNNLKSLRRQDILISVLAIVMMVCALIGNIDPKATGVNQFLPHIFLLLIIVGAIWYLYLKVFSPATIRLMTKDMEAIRTR
jgi:amino acid transporter